jgi:hypothetical protein
MVGRPAAARRICEPPPPVREVAIALVGVAVGALLNYFLGWHADRRRSEQRARGIARLLYRDVFDALMKVRVGLTQKKWPIEDDGGTGLPVSAGPALPIENWNRLGAEFTASVADEDDWESVCLAFESIENENHLMAQGDAFDEMRLRRVQDRDFTEALDVLGKMRGSLSERLLRQSKIRLRGSEFWIPHRHREPSD